MGWTCSKVARRQGLARTFPKRRFDRACTYVADHTTGETTKDKAHELSEPRPRNRDVWSCWNDRLQGCSLADQTGNSVRSTGTPAPACGHSGVMGKAQRKKTKKKLKKTYDAKMPRSKQRFAIEQRVLRGWLQRRRSPGGAVGEA